MGIRRFMTSGFAQYAVACFPEFQDDPGCHCPAASDPGVGWLGGVPIELHQIDVEMRFAADAARPELAGPR